VCGFVFRAHIPLPEELTEIYDEAYFEDDPDRPDRKGYADYRADETAHRRNARKRLEMLGSVAPNAGRMLDVGCAAGYFVAEARRRGWEAEGVDVSDGIVAWGREHVTDALSAKTFADSDFRSTSLSAVTMWDYIEHSVDARADLEHAFEILRPRGVIAISTGDIESLVARLSGRRWHLLTPRHHNYFFGRKTIVRMLRETGFERIRVAHPSAWYAAGHLVYKLQTIVPGKAGRLASHGLRQTPLGRLTLPINLFDIVTVVAQKPASH
jgi:2-polyprenyl-3-methyl-5-hydroxy-6-metoxy-1,4-benzoquinol methylase